MASPAGRGGDRHGGDVRLVLLVGAPAAELAAGMAVSTDVPDGHGHDYGADFANAWAAVLQRLRWTNADPERLRAMLIGSESGG